jgi:hypothetical protein
MGKHYAAIYMRDLLTHVVGKNLDLDEKAAAIETSWSTFLNDELPALIAGVLEIVSPDVTREKSN